MALQAIAQMKVSSVTATDVTLVPGSHRPDPHREATQIVISYPSGKVPAELTVGASVVVHVLA